ncbi:MAG TPA: thioredoxin-disulfide reductase [Candidatus Kapabacteria bacterium]|nr:thioredoxin-disulfide reductase [Candidatus Kapabacteria bacterium]HPO62098.1 thioredoxin-disulfide reductase [Candidatus Kapabacteria bacterium]
MSKNQKLIIIGSGPAGFTAAIYAGRANIDTTIFEGMQPGGQLTITTEVENYPGFPDGVQGPEMMEIFRKQAHKFGAKSIYESITKVDFSKRPFTLYSDANKEYTADAVIIATGATARKLYAKGVEDFWGFGISACATCDGFFYKNADIFVIGGGDTAMEEANYLTHFGKSVTVVHRRNEFRASKIMVERAKKNPKISFLLDSVIEEFVGESKGPIKKLTAIKVKNIKTGEISEHQADGVFFAIGHTPNTEPFKEYIDTDENCYIITKGKSTYTNIPGIFACGDVQDHTYRQAITAAGSGCSAAIDAERWLGEQE